MKTALIDTSSAILLMKAGLLMPVVENYTLIAPEAVYQELTIDGKYGAEAFHRYFTNGLIHLSLTVTPDLPNIPLHGGEADIIRLYRSGVSDFIIVDDRKAGEYCQRQGIPYCNALLMPKILFAAGKLRPDECETKMGILRAIGRYARWVVDFAVRADETTLRDFLPAVVRRT